MAIWDPLIDAVDVWLRNYQLDIPPNSLWLIMVVSIITSTISIAITRWTVDMEKLNSQMRKVQRWNKMRAKARATANKKLWLKVKREENYIKQLQLNMMTARMKPMFITMIPFLLIFTILRGVFYAEDHLYHGIVAVLPFRWDPESLPDIWKIDDIGHKWSDKFSGVKFGTWYFLTALSVGSLFSRFFGTAPPSQ